MTLTTAYVCVLIAAVLPYVWVAFAKTGAAGYNNRNPRAWIGKQEGNYKVQRANGAHLNAFEAFAPFAASVLMAQLAGVDPARIAMLSVAFIAFRILHGLLYLGDKPLFRSLSWVAGFACVAALMVLAIARIG